MFRSMRTVGLPARLTVWMGVASYLGDLFREIASLSLTSEQDCQMSSDVRLYLKG